MLTATSWNPSSDWLASYADQKTRERLKPVPDSVGNLIRTAPPGWDDLSEAEKEARSSRLMLDKGWVALGASDARERVIALNELGFQRQFVFATFALLQFIDPDDPVLLHGGARALSRAVSEFCSVDERLLAVGYVPLQEPGESLNIAKEALRDGCQALMVPARPQGSIAATHENFNPLWELLEGTNPN